MSEEGKSSGDWRIEYQNDTGADDEYFWEWWEITDGETTFKTDKKEDAEWLCGVLNDRP